MRTKIVEGSEVVAQYAQFLMVGQVVKVNKKTYKVHFPKQRFQQEFTKNIAIERVAHIKDKFAMVWEVDRGPEGAYRIDYDNYPELNRDYTHWQQPMYYVSEYKESGLPHGANV